jgi:hypothetical protein
VTPWKRRYTVLRMDANDRLYTQTILAPWSHVDTLRQLGRDLGPEDIYLDRQFRKLARMLQRDLKVLSHVGTGTLARRRRFGHGLAWRRAR